MLNKSLKQIQIETEQLLSKNHIKGLLLQELSEDTRMLEKIAEGIELLDVWTQTESTYESKAMRKQHIASLDLQEIVETVFISILGLSGPTTLNNMMCQLAGKLQFEDTYQGVMACGEIIAVLCNTDVYDLNKPSKYSSVYIEPNFVVSDELRERIEMSQYLPPSKVVPKYLMHNRSSGYQTIKGESLILGGNIQHHTEDICLDVLNVMNAIPLTLNQDMLTINQEPEHDLDVIEDFEGTALQYQKAVSQQKANWELFLKRTELAVDLMGTSEFYLTNKVDKRGRIYTQGYAINIQGNSYQKACIDLANKESIQVPDDYFN